ncbi:ABC transporter permease [Enteractinococcus helveticum]|uniref:ABC transporter permease n=1 Tax=Enteractinococcus helveticum TaxID=1837282 RepID=UPI00082D2AA5|nr:ABC transporter permease [Enteractinococcus helveticum]
MSLLEETLAWFSDPAQWTGDVSIPWRVVEHLGYTLLATAAAAVVAIPLGIFIGHIGRWRNLAVLTTGAMRALPILGLLTLLALWLGIGVGVSVIALAVLCVPPLLAGMYSGLESVHANAVGASRALGMTETQIILRVELPLAMPVILGGLRSSVLQVTATATVAAFIGAGGLGRYIIDGLAVRDTPRVLAGAILVVVLALMLDLMFAAAQRLSARLANPAAETFATSRVPSQSPSAHLPRRTTHDQPPTHDPGRSIAPLDRLQRSQHHRPGG